MIPISAEEFINGLEEKDRALIRVSLEKAVENKQYGETCMVCEQPIWAIGSALSGSNMCFTCLTGLADSSEDYEIDTVCEK